MNEQRKQKDYSGHPEVGGRSEFFSVQRKKVQALDHFDLKIYKGEFTSIRRAVYWEFFAQSEEPFVYAI